MAKVIKTKTKIAGMGEFSAIFNQLLGTDDVDPAITWPKYQNMKTCCDNMIRLFGILANNTILNHPDLTADRSQLQEWLVFTRAEFTRLFDIDDRTMEGVLQCETTFSSNLLEKNEWYKTSLKKFSDRYRAIKESQMVKMFIVTCNNLIVHRHHFEDPEKMSPQFIDSMPGVSWQPFPFLALNAKYLFSLPLVDSQRTFFMLVLAKSLELGHQIYNNISSPDIDVRKFSELVLISVDELKKVPELSRCTKAFSKIRQSIDLLTCRFGGYYRDFIATKDSTIIMQNFLLDVTGESKVTDPVLTAELYKIIAYYRKMSRNSGTNTKLEEMIDRSMAMASQFDKETENIVAIANSD